MGTAETKQRRWTVILSGLLIGILGLIVTLTSRSAFLSPTAVIVVAAVGLAALLLQLRLRHPQMPAVRIPTWLNVLATLLAMTAFFGDILRIRPPVSEVLALLAVGCFAVSGGMIMRATRKQRFLDK